MKHSIHFIIIIFFLFHFNLFYYYSYYNYDYICLYILFVFNHISNCFSFFAVAKLSHLSESFLMLLAHLVF